MKLHCHRPSLSAAFHVVSGVVPSRTPKEILKNVKLSVADGAATLVGTDQEVGIRYTVPGIETDSAGEALLPTARVVSILRELQDDSVDIEVTPEAVWVRSGHSEFRLSAGIPADFPPVAAFEDQAWHSVPAAALKRCVRRTAFATDAESTRYALGGLQLELLDNRVTLAATDSRRLAVVSAECGKSGDPMVPERHPVVPTKAMTVVERTLDEEGDVRIAVHPNDVVLQSGPCTVYSRIVEGRFPQYRDVIPNETQVKIDLLVGPFHAAIRQAQIVTNEESRGVDFEFGNGLMTLTSKAADIGQSKVELPISYEGESLTVTFDPRYVAEFLRVLEPENQVQLNLIDSESAAVFRTDDDYTYVVMPLARDR